MVLDHNLQEINNIHNHVIDMIQCRKFSGFKSDALIALFPVSPIDAVRTIRKFYECHFAVRVDIGS